MSGVGLEGMRAALSVDGARSPARRRRMPIRRAPRKRRVYSTASSAIEAKIASSSAASARSPSPPSSK
jgi:hypothetical protein